MIFKKYTYKGLHYVVKKGKTIHINKITNSTIEENKIWFGYCAFADGEDLKWKYQIYKKEDVKFYNFILKSNTKKWIRMQKYKEIFKE